jgi:hypothetical protein
MTYASLYPLFYPYCKGEVNSGANIIKVGGGIETKFIDGGEV